jgi:hypothetical protein
LKHGYLCLTNYRNAAVIGRPLHYREIPPEAARQDMVQRGFPAAFAGQQDTYLNVVGEEAVLDAVRRCWGSLWTDRAIAYRRKRVGSTTAKYASDAMISGHCQRGAKWFALASC